MLIDDAGCFFCALVRTRDDEIEGDIGESLTDKRRLLSPQLTQSTVRALLLVMDVELALPMPDEIDFHCRSISGPSGNVTKYAAYSITRGSEHRCLGMAAAPLAETEPGNWQE